MDTGHSGLTPCLKSLLFHLIISAHDTEASLFLQPAPTTLFTFTVITNVIYTSATPAAQKIWYEQTVKFRNNHTHCYHLSVLNQNKACKVSLEIFKDNLRNLDVVGLCIILFIVCFKTSTSG